MFFFAESTIRLTTEPCCDNDNPVGSVVKETKDINKTNDNKQRLSGSPIIQDNFQ